jgi:hypothetical protein
MLGGPQVERLIKSMNVILNMFKEKSKIVYGWSSIKKFEQGKDESRGSKVHKEGMVFEEAKAGAKRARALAT